MLEIGVCLPSELVDGGEWLAEARALEAAAAHSLWVEQAGSLDAWSLLGGLAAATSCRLGLLAGPASADQEALWRGALTVDLLSRGRLLVALSDQRQAAELLARRPSLAVLLRADSAAGLEGAAGILMRMAEPATVASLVESAEERQVPIWVEVLLPEDRPAWRQLRGEYEAAGAAGLVVGHDRRLVDMLRNPDQEEDRSDLQLAQG